MSLNTATSSMRALSLSCAASSSRHFTSSAAVLAGGKGPKKSNVQQAGKRKAVGFAGKAAKSRPIMGPMNKGIKLSYAMAVPAPDLGDLTPYSSDVITAEHVGTPTVFTKQAVQAINSFGLPRRMDKEFKSGGPATVIRSATVDMASRFQSEAGSSSQDSRYMLTGDVGSGKSVLLVQSVAQALSAGWIVIYAPRAQSWIDSSAPYAYSPETQTFHQPTIATSMLNSILSVNGAALKQIKIDSTNLFDFIKDVVRDTGGAPKGLERVFDVLAKQTQSPVLFAIDEVNALFSKSVYRSPEYELLEAYHLSTPRLALDYLSGRKAFARGMTLSTYSHSTPNLALTTDFLYALELPTHSPITPYSKFEPTHLAHASSGFKKIEVPYGMSPKEASGLFQIYARKGWLRRSNDEVFMGAFMASAGNPKELRREWLGDLKAYEQFDPSVSV
ncbi:mitochondrial ribosomal death-associated protein 3-domain-containing protein [Papiliotrema laurentii]|uniref:Small ribosomal subunit protein mS29 n=1 Tax=Papiliotrema laurentii TaxID=5418 RepID=A0AAD9FNH0_PAPLA|nr:mitochondrial ribosomal death-associated protein 3-domain-containing protein [Papiliotrema laurentii]